jgi:hypothetical protein
MQSSRYTCDKTKSRKCFDSWMVPTESAIEPLRDAGGGKQSRTRKRDGPARTGGAI